MIHEKDFLGVFEKEQYIVGLWLTPEEVQRRLFQSGIDLKPKVIQMMIDELQVNFVLEEKGDGFEPIFRLTPEGWGRRFELCYYLDKENSITFNETQGINTTWVHVQLNGVVWGNFPGQYKGDIDTNLHRIAHSLCTGRRTNKQILEAIRKQYSKISAQ